MPRRIVRTDRGRGQTTTTRQISRRTTQASVPLAGSPMVVQALAGSHGRLSGLTTSVKARLATGTAVGTVAAAASNASQKLTVDIRPPRRPHWRDSEAHVEKLLASDGFAKQKSFLRGNSDAGYYGKKGTTRPDLYKQGTSVEVKNYNIQTSRGRSRLMRNILAQARHRKRHLPPGTRQMVYIDVRGQAVDEDSLDQMIDEIVRDSGGIFARGDLKLVRP